MSGFRKRLAVTGVGGLAAAGLLAALAGWLAGSGIMRPPLPYPMVTAALAVVLGGLSVAEIPLMVAAMRHLAGQRPGNSRLVLGLNVVFVFFAAVYGAPVALLTGNVAWALALSALSFVRLAASLLFVDDSRMVTS